MKSIYSKIILGAAVAMGLASCDLNLIPEDAVRPDTYFRTETDLQLWTNGFYRLLDDPETFTTRNADDVIDDRMDNVIIGTRSASDAMNGINEWNWKYLRDINYYLEHSSNCADEALRKQYDGVAYFFRAYFYFQKVLRFGDVPWYDSVIDSEDQELLKKGREDRDVIMTHVMEDLDNAIASLPTKKDVARVTKWTALALKSRAALFEGTWRKYRGLPKADDYLALAADAAENFIDNSGYTIYKTGTEPYRALFCSDKAISEEVILAHIYNSGLNIMTSVQFNMGSWHVSFTKRFMNHYLNADGTSFTDAAGYATKTYAEETAGRDPRMAQTVICPGYKQVGASAETVNDMSSLTGYAPVKFIDAKAYSGSNKGIEDISLFRAAEVYLNFAEAKAELGTLAQADLDKSVNKIRERVSLPDLNMATANANIDAYLATCYPNVNSGANKGVILEIRRERTVELVLEGLRMWDMFRWKEGAQIVNSPNRYLGIYFAGAGVYDLNGDGTDDFEIYSGDEAVTKDNKNVVKKKLGKDIYLSETTSGNVVAYSKNNWTWDENRDYLWPIPADQRVLTGGALSQNPGWTDSTNFN